MRFITSGRSPVGMPQPLDISADLDLTVLMFAAAAALGTGLLLWLGACPRRVRLHARVIAA